MCVGIHSGGAIWSTTESNIHPANYTYDLNLLCYCVRVLKQMTPHHAFSCNGLTMGAREITITSPEVSNNT